MKCHSCGAKMRLYSEIKDYEYYSYMCDNCHEQKRSEITTSLVFRNFYSKFRRIPRNQRDWRKFVREQLREINI